jgi:glycosyltransferase involved in cell wall biosynthesis
LNVYAAADRVLTVSRKEALLTDDFLSRPGHADVFPDFESVTNTEPPESPAGRFGMLYVGNFRHPPNREALEWFITGVMPLIDATLLAHHPLTVIGTDLPADFIQRLQSSQSCIRWVGWVPDLGPYVDQARVSIVPLRSGAGTKRKLIDAMSRGLPSVTTSVGAEGLDVIDRRDALVADEPRAFAEAIELLLTNDERWTSLSAAGQTLVRASHDASSTSAPLERLISLVS